MFNCAVCGRESKNKSVIDKCKHTRKKDKLPAIIDGSKEAGVAVFDVGENEKPSIKNEPFVETVLYSGGMDIKKIYHCSDIHIRLASQHAEYREVFGRFYEMLRSEASGSAEGIIVCCGDILHSKNELSPECVVLCLEFLTELAKIMPLIFIAGNHDAVLTNSDRMDSLSAVIDKRDIPGLYYLKYTGVYRYNNILFGVSSLLDEGFVYSSQIVRRRTGDITVGLFHGSVGTPLNDQGFKISGEKPVSEFAGYDYVLLGDIHMFQYLNPEKTIAYSSSLISQNFGECDPCHGYLEWDLVSGTSDYRIVPNDTRYMRVRLGDSLEEVPAKANLEIIISKELEDTDEAYRLKVLSEKARIAGQLPSAKVRYVYTDTANKTDVETGGSKLDYSSKCLVYLKTQWPSLSADDIEWVMSKVDFNISAHSCSKYQLLVMEWDYMGKYGKGNHFDFRRLKQHGISGILANNSMGKSTFIDILTFMLFGKTNRNISNRKHIPTDIINIHQNKCVGRLYFRTSQEALYQIEKSCVRGKDDNVRLTSSFYQLVPAVAGPFEWEGERYERVALHGKDRLETDKLIGNIIGSYEDFLFQSVFLQFDNVSFRTMAPKERKDFMFRLFQLDHFTKQYGGAKDLIKHTKAQLDYVRGEISKVDMVFLEERLSELGRLKEELIGRRDASAVQLVEIGKKREELLRSLVPCGKAIDKRRLLELKGCLDREFNYLDRRAEIMADYMVRKSQFDNWLVERVDKKAQLKSELKTVVSLDFDEGSFARLASMDFPEDLEYQINDLQRKVAENGGLTSEVVVQKPRRSKEAIDEELAELIGRLDIFGNRLEKAICQKALFALDDTVVDRYNEYLAGKTKRDALEVEKSRLEVYIADIKGGDYYNPDCYICLKNPLVERVNKASRDLVEVERQLLEIQLDKEIVDIYQVYNVLRVKRDAIIKEIETVGVDIQSGKLRVIELEKELDGVYRYDIYMSRQTNHEKLVELLECKRLKDEFGRLKSLYPVFIQNREIAETNRGIYMELANIDQEIKQMGNFKHSDHEMLVVEEEAYGQLDSIRKEVGQLEECQRIYVENQRIELIILELDERLAELSVDLTGELMCVEKEMGEAMVRLETCRNYGEQFKALSLEAYRYNILGEVLGINGFSLYLLRDRLEVMSQGISKIMNKYMGVSLKLDVQNGDLVVFSYRDSGLGTMNRLDTFGGKETLIYDISFRIYSVLNLGLPFGDIMIFDETFMSFDINSKSIVPEILGLFTTYYSNIIMITHDNYYKDYIDTPIQIGCVEGYSRMSF